MSWEYSTQFSVTDGAGTSHNVEVYAEYTLHTSITHGVQKLTTGQYQLRIGNGQTLNKVGDGEYVLSGTNDRFTSTDANRF